VKSSADFRVIGGGLTILAVVAVALWIEFSDARQTGWDIFLGGFLVALVAAAFAGQRYFRAHAGEIGEARFDTRNEDDR